MFFSLSRRSTLLLTCVLGALGCGGPQPSAPPPKGGYRTEPVSYEPKPHPGITVVSLGEIPLAEEQSHAIPPDVIPIAEHGKLLAVEGTVIHPDDRITIGPVFLRLLTPNSKKPGEFDIANEMVVMATGEKGHLTYRCELRIPEKGPNSYTLRMVFDGPPPGIQPGDEPRQWTVPFAEGVLKVSGSQSSPKR